MNRPERAPHLLMIALLCATTACSSGFWRAAGKAIGEAMQEAQRQALDASRLPRTRAERTGYRETSRYADVVQFLDSLQRIGAGIHVGAIGRTTEGRDIPYVIASRPLVRTPAEARRLGRPVVYVQANIHAGEVEGKEAMQALLRDLVAEQRANALDSIVLITVPIYNADGNERVAPQSRNRSEQNGPELVGERPNAQRLDLNRDYVKAEAPETRASLAMFASWDPELFVDLHTTNGSYHGYALTYSPSLTPAAPGGAWARDSLLPELRRRVRARHGFETFDYGNFSTDYGADVNTDTVKQGWYSYDHRPRFGTNYYGLRGRVAVLAEAYSHDPFERRVKATHAFVSELLSLAAERAPALRAFSAERDRRGGWWGEAGGATPAVPLRADLTRTPYTGEVLAEDLASDPDSVPDEPGLPRGLRRTGRVRTLRIPVYDRFDPTLRRAMPAAYALDASQGDAVQLLRLHGVVVERLTGDWPAAPAQAFVVESVTRAPRTFQGHNEVHLAGRWRGGERGAERLLPAGSFVVPTSQPLGVLAMYLLEPESDDGLATWNVFDRWLRVGSEFPVLRVMEPVSAPRRAEP